MLVKTQQSFKHLLYSVVFLFLFQNVLLAQTILFQEDFSSGSLPAGWTNVANGGTTNLWQLNNPGNRTIGGDFDVNFAIVDSDFYGSGNTQNTTLTSAAFTVNGGGPEINLKYEYQYREIYATTSITVELFNGSSWNQIASYSGAPNHPGTTTESINIASYFTGTVNDARVRFTYVATYEFWLAIDNLIVELPSDVDGDGIADADDLDTDGDGIPDEVETECYSNPASLVFENHWGSGVDPLSVAASPPLVFENVTVSLERRDPGNILDFSVGETGITTHNTVNSYKLTQASVVGGTSEHIFKFSSPAENVVFGVLDVDDGTNFTDHIEVKGYSGGSVYTIQAADIVSGSANTFNAGLNTFTGIAPTTTYPNGVARVTFPVPLDSIVMVYSNLDATPSATQAIGFELSIDFNCQLSDADKDGIPNHLDLDSDNDGIPDIVEAGGVDANGDGIYDGTLDTDGDGIADYADADLGSCSGDGSAPPDGICDDVQAGAPGASGTDTDGDGIDDNFDVDANGDGIQDIYVSNTIGNKDSDGDGILDQYDLDADNDGIPDVVEVGGTDANGDGRIDDWVDTDNDGFNDVVDGDVGNNGVENTANALVLTGADTNNNGTPNSYLTDDVDGDGFLDHVDLDADNDGIADVVEAGGTDANGDGRADGYVDVDMDGFNDVVDGDPNNSLPAGDDTADTNSTDALVLTGDDTNSDGTPDSYPNGDTDSDGNLDHLDLDADNDGIADVVEAGGTDTNGDGRADDYVDADMDGFNDVVDGDPNNSLVVGDDSADTNTTDALVLTGTDVNGDGTPDSYPANDTDKDGHLDHLDLDADNDGIADVVEAGGTDTNGDGRADNYVDLDMDGFNDVVDGDPNNDLPVADDSAGTNTTDALVLTGADTNGDGTPNSYPANDMDKDGHLDHLDLDADNDGIADVVEAGGTDTNGDGRIDDYVDTDNDGFNDVVDGDPNNSLVAGDDNAGTNTTDALVLTGADTDADGTPNSYATDDTDNDGYLNHLDLDADNDGIADVVEAGGTDENGDGRADDYVDADMDGFNDVVDGDPNNSLVVGDDSADTNTTDALVLTGADTNGNGTPNSYPTDDTDKDGHLDYLDLDADNDGIADVVEAGGTDVNGDGRADDYVDADNDGFNDVVDGDPDNSLVVGDDSVDTNTADALVLTGADANSDGTPDSYPSNDTDKDGALDYLDIDADNDGIADVVEAGGTDNNGDGRIDDYVDADNDGFNDVVDGDPNNSLAAGDDTNDTNTAAVLVLTGADTNGDGAPNSYPTDDTDKDGHLNHLDLDADNDGIADVVEAGGTDVNGDGRADDYADADNDGFNDVVDGDPDNSLSVGNDNADTNTSDALVLTEEDRNADGIPDGYLKGDMDGDAHLNHLDLDADNDGIADVVEADGTDANGDGFADNYVDVDKDGFNDVVDGDPNNSLAVADDSADTNTSDALQLTGVDANGDGTPDSYPEGDTDGDTRLDQLDLDADNDGIADVVEAGGADDNLDGFVDNFDPTTGMFTGSGDTDADGFSNFYDNDTDNNGSTGDATPLILTSADSNGDGAPESIIAADMDKDGIYNHLDLDADNDGIIDLIESQGTDINGDGMVDDFDPLNPTVFDTGDNDGWSPTYDGDAANDGTTTTTGDGTVLIETQDKNLDGFPDVILKGDAEGDNYPNFLDIDADNDGIVDNVEGQSTPDYSLPNTTTVDTDKDGLNDSYDNFVGFGGTGIDADTGDAQGDPYDHDMDGTPDYLDLDADGDNIPDIQEAWDDLFDGDSQTDSSIGTCDGTDVDKDGLLDCFDSNTSDPTVTAYDTPIDDNAYNGGAATGMAPTSGSTPDDIFPDNGGLDDQADWRDVLIDCGTPKVYYAATEESAGTTTDYELDGAAHVDGSGTQIVRATAACEPDADGWFYYYNVLEPENFLFAIKNSAGSPNTVPLWDLIDYVETKVEDTPTDRHMVGAGSATFVMERDWNVAFKGTPTTGSTFDVKFYFDPAEMATLKNAADAVEANATGVTRDFYWVEKTGGIENSDITDSGVTGMEDITDFDSNVSKISDSNPTQADGTSAGNGKNFVSFEGISDFSGGSAVIIMTYAALPVELSRFTAKKSGCNVQLNWVVESEEKFSHYEIEWSGGGRDFQKIGTVEGRGSVQTQVYEFTDRHAAQENYYRLKMVDEDGTFEYSNIVAISTDCGDLVEGISMYPNPMLRGSAGLNVRFFSEHSEAIISITDMLGRTVKRYNLTVEKDWNTLFLNTSELASGSYYLKIEGRRGAEMFIIQD